jgi:hypothetical protein
MAGELALIATAIKALAVEQRAARNMNLGQLAAVKHILANAEAQEAMAACTYHG